MPRVVAVVCGALAAALLGALPALADPTTIADVDQNGEALSGLEVTVVGTVTPPVLAYANDILYDLVDGGHRITVTGHGAAPSVGDQVQVTATVGWKAPDDEFTWPPVLFEVSRQPAP